MHYVCHLLVVILIYVQLAISLDLIAGRAGLISMAQAAFFGCGAYIFGLLAVSLGWPFLVCVAAAAGGVALLGALLGRPASRVAGDVFIVATLALQLITFELLNNWVAVTRGPMGIAGIPMPRIIGWTVHSRGAFLCLLGVVSLVVFIVYLVAVRSPFGRLLAIVREDTTLGWTIGKNLSAVSLAVFAVAGAIAGSAGAFYASYLSFIDPSSFTLAESIFLLSIVVVGGAGSAWGPLLGSVVLVTLPEVLRFIGLPNTIAADVRQVLYGASLTACMFWRPRGLAGKYDFLETNAP